MIAIFFGLICLLFAGFATLPFAAGLGWGDEFIYVLKGALPLLAIGLGFLSILVGIADKTDARHAKKEALIQREFEEKQENAG